MSEGVGFTNGCFDLLHDGHRHLIRECQARCDRLIVAMNTDASVRRLKGKGRPILPSYARAADIRQILRANDECWAFDGEEALLQIIYDLKPDLIFKGGEYIGKRVTGDFIAPVHFVSMLPGYSTTNEIAKRDRLA